MIRHARPQIDGRKQSCFFLSRSAPRSILRPRDWLGIDSGFSRERLGEVGESKRVSKTGLSVFWGETARNAVSTSDHGFRCHVELDAETVRFDYVSITCRLRLVYVSFTCFTAECQLIYLFRAPHLLRILATGNYSVQFLLYFDMLPHKWGPLRKYSRTLPDILAPISGNFLAKGLRPLFCRV